MEIHSEARIDAFAALLDREKVVVLNAGLSNDRIRLNAGHELGHHLYNDCVGSSQFTKKEIEKRVAQLDGVIHVNNDIVLLPVSRHDDQLRHRVARAIYGNPNFGRYGATVNPSIHIIVNGGHVTLTSVVMSEVDRRLARLLAGRFHAFSVTNELRLPDEVTAELEQLG